MKRIFQATVFALLAMAMPLQAQEQPEEMYTLQGKTKLVVNEKYRATNETDEYRIDTIPRKLVETFPFTVGRYSYELKYYKLTGNGWDGEPGDFHIMQLFHNGKQLLEFVDLDGMCEHTPNSIFDADMKKISSIPNRFAIVCPLAQEVTALIFDGYQFPYEPSKVPILVVKGDQAAMLLNRNLGIDTIVSADGFLEVTFVDSFQEDVCKDDMGNPVPTEWNPERFRLFSTPAGTLKFHKLKEVQRNDLRSVGL